MTALNHIATAIILFALIGSTSAATSVSQYGITWTFDEDYQTGQFATGDYWVIGPVTIIDIDPVSTDIDGRIRHGSMVNPISTDPLTQGYDNLRAGYVSSLNAARPNGSNLNEGNPLELSTNSSLVSAISFFESYGLDGRAQLQSAAILTVLGAAPPAGSFRPAYSGSDKTIQFTKNDLDYSLLLALPITQEIRNVMRELKPLPGEDRSTLYGVRNLSVESVFERPWIDHLMGHNGRPFAPLENRPSYDAWVCNQVSTAALMLHLDYSNEDDFYQYGSNEAYKEALLIGFVQVGIDHFGVIQNGSNKTWYSDSCRKFPIVFAGFALDNQNIKNLARITGDYAYDPDGTPRDLIPSDHVWFEEDLGPFFVTQADIDITNSPEWEPDYRDSVRISYDAGDLGLPEWTKSHIENPEYANKWWNTAYRRVTPPHWDGFTLAIQIMNIKDLWNRASLFDYIDRYTEIEPATDFAGRMWQEYRTNYGCVWTRDDQSDLYSQGHIDCSQCVYNCEPGDPCSNRIKDGDETGIDCGGSCTNQNCCTNGYRDSELGEEGIDCGGPCAACPAQECQGTDTQCGTWPDCQNCNLQDECIGDYYRNYSCSGTSCTYAEDDCSDCSCSCGGYNTTESLSNNNCSDGKDNDCDGQTDTGDTGCQPGTVPTDYIAYWPFDNSLLDESQNNNNGTFQGGTASYTTGHLEQAIELNGNDQYVNVGNHASLNQTGSLTLTAWINPDTFGQNDWGRIVDKGGDRATSTGFSFFLNGALNSLGYVVYGGNAVNADPNILSLGEWQHTAITYDETGQRLTFYVNGEQSGSAAYADSPADSTAYSLVIGIRDYDMQRDFDGSIDEVRIYARALSNEEIQSIYNFSGQECISMSALLNYISQWKQGSLEMSSLLQRIAQWKANAGC